VWNNNRNALSVQAAFMDCFYFENFFEKPTVSIQ